MADKNIKTTWDLSPLLKSDDDPAREQKRKDVLAKTSKFVQSWKTRTDYLSDAKALRQALDEFEDWSRTCAQGGDETYYYWLRAEQDQNDPDLKGKLNQAEEFSRKIADETRFFELSLSKIPTDEQARLLDDPALQEYRHFLERLFAQGKYLLSEPEERVIDFKSSSAHTQWVRMVAGLIAKEESDILIDGKSEKKNFSELLSLLEDKRKEVRDCAARALNLIFVKYLDVAESEINAILGDKKSEDELRSVPRPDILRHVHDDIETEVVDVVIETIKNRFDIAQDFYKFKAKLLGAEKLAYHERKLPYGQADKEFKFDKAVDLVRGVFANLDPEFVQILDRFLINGQIDVFPQKGKHNGAFCSHLLISQPTYVLLNHNDRLSDVMTLAHEMGHAINNELMRPAQNGLYFGTSTASAEVASTFMEDFVLEKIRSEADDELRLAMMVMKLDDDVASIFRQAACYRFEQELHQTFSEKGYLSHQTIGEMFRKHMAAYMGEAVEQSAGSENWWVYWSHIRNFFYVYSYASGLLISKALQAQVRADKTKIAGVKEFLAAGISASPHAIFLGTGIDIAKPDFWHQGLNEVEGLLKEAKELAQKLSKI